MIDIVYIQEDRIRWPLTEQWKENEDGKRREQERKRNEMRRTEKMPRQGRRTGGKETLSDENGRTEVWNLRLPPTQQIRTLHTLFCIGDPSIYTLPQADIRDFCTADYVDARIDDAQNVRAALLPMSSDARPN